MQAGDWDVLEKIGMPKKSEVIVQGQTVATAPLEGVLADQGDSETLQEVVQAYPVEKALPNTGQLDKHGLSHGEWSRICNPK